MAEATPPAKTIEESGEPISKVHPMGETAIVSVDRLTGEIVSASKC
jgi:hypothetical protein